MRPAQHRPIHASPMSNSTSRQVPSDTYAGRAPTPGLDDSPYIHFAIGQLTRDQEVRGLSRTDSIASEDLPPAERLVWDEGLGCFVRPSGPERSPPSVQRSSPRHKSQQSLSSSPRQPPSPQHSSPRPTPDPRLPPNSVDPETYTPVDPPEDSLLYPPLDYVPIVLRPLALSAIILCCLLMIAGVAFCNAWAPKHQGLWNYNGQGGGRYFVVQFLPQILAAIITIWTFVIQAALYRTMPFAIMGSERPLGHVLQKLSILPRNFLLPDLSHFRHGEALVGFALLTIWISNFITIPLLSCFFQAKWYVIDGEGMWRWTSVLSVGWTLIAVYGLLVIGLLLLTFRFLNTWSGLMWDPVCLADLISIIQRSNVLRDFEQSETVPNVGETLDPRVLRLGYWQLPHHEEVFYGVGEVDAPIGNPSLHLIEKNRAKQYQGLSKVSFDLEGQTTMGKGEFDEHLYSPSVRYRWTPWFLQKTFIVAWTVTICALFIAFVLVSFIHDAIKGGFPPRLPTLPSTGAFSSSNFLYSFIPAFIGNVLFLAWQPIDVYFRALQPFVGLSRPEGAPAEQSLLLAYPSCFPFQVTILAIMNKHYKVAWISFMAVASAAIPIIAGGVFLAMWYPSHEEIRIAALMPAFYALIVFCGLYTISFFAIWPRRCRYLPHDISTLADQMSFLYQSPLLADKLLREPRSKADLVTRLVIAPPGDREFPTYGFGIFVGRDGKEHLGIDRFHRPGRADMLTTKGL